MPQNIGVNPNLQQLNDIQTQLATQGVSIAQIDAWIQTQGIESVLSDNRLVAQYFITASRALNSLTQPNYDDRLYSLTGEPPPPLGYQPYFSGDRDSSSGVPYVDYLPEQNLMDSQWMVDNGYFTPTMASAFDNLTTYGYFSQGGDANTGTTGTVTPTGTRAMSVGSKGMGVTTRRLESPSTSPLSSGTGSGAYGGGTTGGVPGAPGAFTQADWDYISTLEEGPAKEWLTDLLGDAETQRSVVYNITTSLEADREATQRINQLIEGLDPTNPQDAHRIMTLTNERGMLQESIREKTDNMMRITRLFEERVSLIKNFIEIDNRAREAIIRNMRSG